VEAAQAAYRKAADDPELLGLLHLMGSTPEIVARFKRDGDAVVGLNAKGETVAKAPLKEPTIVRPYHDQERQVYRHNIT
jgi:nitrate reductase beta subunit